MMVLHQRTHPLLDQPGCFGCKAASIRMAADAMPFRKEALVTMQDSWARQMRDDAAYVRLYKDGLNPARTAGCHELEQCDNRNLIEGTPMLWDRREEILADLSDAPQVKVES